MLQDRLEDFLNHLEKIYKEKNIDLSKVYLPQRIKKPSCIAKASECILVCSSNLDLAIYIITLEMDGVVVRGNVNLFCNYPSRCKEVISMCVNRNILCVSHKGTPGGVASIKLDNLMVDMVVKNGTVDCSESSHVAPYNSGIVFADTDGASNQGKDPQSERYCCCGNRK